MVASSKKQYNISHTNYYHNTNNNTHCMQIEKVHFHSIFSFAILAWMNVVVELDVNLRLVPMILQRNKFWRDGALLTRVFFGLREDFTTVLP